MGDFGPVSWAASFDAAGIPRPDGTPLGDALHVLSLLENESDNRVIFRGTVDVYGEGVVTGLSLGDLRALFALAEAQMKTLNIERGKQV